MLVSGNPGGDLAKTCYIKEHEFASLSHTALPSLTVLLKILSTGNNDLYHSSMERMVVASH